LIAEYDADQVSSADLLDFLYRCGLRPKDVAVGVNGPCDSENRH
jgi:hypothetical protein